jgi:hypothetical protein
MSPTVLYNILTPVIPAPVFTGINSSRNPVAKTGFPRIKYGAGFSGMTDICKAIIETVEQDMKPSLAPALTESRPRLQSYFNFFIKFTGIGQLYASMILH